MSQTRVRLPKRVALMLGRIKWSSQKYNIFFCCADCQEEILRLQPRRVSLSAYNSIFQISNGWQGSSGFVWVLWRNIKGSAHKLMKQVQTGGDNNMEGKQQSRGLEYSHVFLWTFATMILMICGKLCSQKYKGNGINLNWEMVS